MQISNYFAQVSVDVDKASLKRVDALLSQIESRFTKFQKRISQLTKTISVDVKFDQAKFKSQFNNLKIPAIKIDQFQINSSSLNRAIQSAASAIAPITLRSRVVPPSIQRLQQGYSGAQERSQRRTSGLSTAFGLGSGGGFGVGILARGGPVGTAVAAAGAAALYGTAKLSDYNEINQDVQSKRQSLTSVLSGYGMENKDSEVFQWLRSQADKTGTNYREALPDFTGMIANGLSMGQSLEQVQDMFRGITEYGRSLSIDPQRMKRLSTSFNQMLSKGTIYSEELFGQASEAAPGIAAVFAQAWQKLNKGSLTGADSLKALRKAMEDGEVVSSRILPIVSQLLQERAAPGLALKAQSSMAQQARFQNTRTDFAMQVSNTGMEQGFARIFDSLNNALERISPLAESLGKRFNSFSESLSSSITKISEGFAVFNGYASSFNKLSLSDGTISALQSLSDTFDKLGENVNLLKERLSTIASSPLFQTVANVFGGIASYVLNVFNSLANAINAALKGNFKQAVKELSGATPLSLLPQITSPVEQRMMDAKNERDKEVKEFNTFNQVGGNISLPSLLSLTPSVDVVVQSQKEREKALAGMRVLGQTNALPEIVLNNKTELPKFIAPVINFQKERQQRLQLPDVKIATPNVVAHKANKVEQVDKMVEQKTVQTSQFSVNPNITVSATVNATNIDDMTDRVTEIFRYEFKSELSKELTGVMSAFGTP
ncbi:tape measure protein [Azotobacter chroococcum]|uniref:tape measure protein n=1 Tax=Azotobacter chroococcum TaxID=353 RepID=UPI000A4AEA02|nr:tape measure protein [Azotobacter chroococcum]